MPMTRFAKTAMVACLALFAALVTCNNLLDYGANFAFVQHVLRMDTVFPGSPLRWRAIDLPLLWHLAYALIILGEGVTAVLLARGAWALWRARRRSARVFNQAKQWALAGVLAGFCVWFLGFMVVGAEWFLMWQSSQWNGQESAFRFCITLLAVAIFVNQPDTGLAQRTHGLEGEQLQVARAGADQPDFSGGCHHVQLS